MANPAWAPTLAQVATYVPGRTLAVDTTSDALQGTFNATTRPTDTQVQQLITDACSWVLARAGDIVTTGQTAGTLATMATSVATLRAAGMVELAYPQRAEELNTSQQLLDQADKMLDELVAANAAAGASDAGPAILLPTGSFPDPPTWGDDLLI